MPNHYRDLSSEPQRPELSQDVKALIDNGLDFLEKALEELESSKPKFSVVSFWTAVEILLKVPLVHEHWTLACTGKKLFGASTLPAIFSLSLTTIPVPVSGISSRSHYLKPLWRFSTKSGSTVTAWCISITPPSPMLSSIRSRRSRQMPGLRSIV